MKLDRTRIREAVVRLAGESSALKKMLTVRWTRPMADEQRRRVVLRRMQTELLTLLAHCRGKLHVKAPPRGAADDWTAEDYRDRVLARLAPEYAVPAENAVVAR